MTDLQARVARILAKARRDEGDVLPRLRAENPDFAAFVDTFRMEFGARVTYLLDKRTGKSWGATAEERAKRAGGLGISVPAGAGPKGRRRKRAAAQR
jgi:hypothetical protein